MNILIIGEGGFARKLGDKLKLSHHYDKHFFIPVIEDNQLFKQMIKISLNDEDGIVNFCIDQKIDIVVIADKQVLVTRIYNILKNNAHLSRTIIIGASKETVEFFTYQDSFNNFIVENNIPHTKHKSTELEVEKIEQIVILTDGKTFKILNEVSSIDVHQIEQNIIAPTLFGLSNKSFFITGFLCCNIIQQDERFELLSYQFIVNDNVAEEVFEKLETDVLSLFAAMDNGTLEDVNIEFYEK